MTRVSSGSCAAMAADSPCGRASTTTSYPARLAASLGATTRSAYGSRWGCSSPRRRPALELACTPASRRLGCPASSRHTSPPAYPVAPVTPTVHVCPLSTMHEHTGACMDVHSPCPGQPTWCQLRPAVVASALSVSAEPAADPAGPEVDDEELARSELMHVIISGRIASLGGPQREERRHGTDDRHGRHATQARDTAVGRGRQHAGQRLRRLRRSGTAGPGGLCSHHLLPVHGQRR